MSGLKPPDVESVNPRYRGMKLSDVARVLLRPKNPAARAALDRLQGRSVTEKKVAEDPPSVESALIIPVG